MISVLCVDDDSAHLEISKRFLEKQSEMAVTTALSAREALKMMETNRFDAVVSDYQMPGMDGIGFLKAIRAKNPYIPFILLTGKGREEVAIEAFTNGTDFYVKKGRNPKVLFAKLEETIKKAVKIGVERTEFHHSEARYRRLFETSPDGILVVDAESGVITDTNPLLLTLLGYTREEILGKNIWDIGVIREKSLAEQAAADLKKTGYLRYDNLPLKTKDGGDLTVELVSSSYDAETQKLVQINIRNISDRKKAEEALRESEDKYRTVFENTGTAMVVLEENNIISIANAEFANLSGFSKDDIEGKKKWTEFVVREDQEWMLAQHRLRTQNHEKALTHYEFHFVTKSGDIRNIYLSIDVIPGTKKSVASLLDITERKQSENTLFENEKFLTNIVEQIPDMIFVKDAQDLRFVRFNKAGEDLLGYSREELLGKNDYDFFPKPEADFFTENDKDVIHKNQLLDIPDEKIQTRHKGERILHTKKIPIVDEYGHPKYLLGISEDITERKKTEEAMRTFSEDLERKVIERTSELSDVNLKLMTEIGIRLEAEKQLTKTVGEKEVLIREVHHRVKNNLQIIISLLNLQSRYITDATTLAAFRESQNRVRAMALVHEKLYQSTDLAKIDFDNYIGFLINNLLQFFGMKGKGILLTMDIKDIFLATDTAIPLGLIINELISNSLKYAFPGGRTGEISLAIQREDHTLTILFKDNGVGIPNDFDWRNARSMGLRLVITLVDQLEGTIELDRTAGTIFRINVKEKL